MSHLNFYCCLISLLCFCNLPAVTRAETIDTDRRPPNLIVILADDLGYGDLSGYGSTVHHTPHLDFLAQNGVKFTDFYMTSPVCTPSRVALLTGRHPVRVGFSTLLWPTTTGGLPADERTLAEILGENGYVSALAGKWHLGHSDSKYLPLAHGFDSFYGMPYPNDMDNLHPQTRIRGEEWPPMPMMRGNEMVEAPIDVNLLTRQYTAEAIRFIAENHHRPFFLFLSHAMPHTIIGASPVFRGSSENGLYGDAVQELDWSVGEVLETLRAFGLEEHTLMVFSSDNGGVIPEQFHDKEDVARRFFPDGTMGSNAPLRSGKQSTYEGGVRVPGIFYWPGTLSEGQVSAQPAWIADLFPTFLELADIPLPTDRRYDGVSLKNLLTGETERLPERTLAFGSNTITAVRQGRWKLVLPEQPRFVQVDSQEPMLYDLGKDPEEKSNLAELLPERLAEMMTALRETERSMLEAER